jgi:hypothetical protein
MSGWKVGDTDETVCVLQLGADGRSACIWCYRLRDGAPRGPPFDRHRPKGPEDEGFIVFFGSALGDHFWRFFSHFGLFGKQAVRCYPFRARTGSTTSSVLQRSPGIRHSIRLRNRTT